MCFAKKNFSNLDYPAHRNCDITGLSEKTDECKISNTSNTILLSLPDGVIYTPTKITISNLNTLS